MFHEQIHRLRLHDERACRPVGIAIEVLMHAVVVHDRRIAGFPLVANAVVDLRADAVHDVEDRFIHVAVLLRLAARRIFFKMDVQRLSETVRGVEELAAVLLRARCETALRGP